jgi:GT2 family glycosyltransferase
MDKILDIIIPTYNGIDNLKLVLNSLYRQSFRDFRIIVVDNASTDGSVEYIENEFRDVIIIRNPDNFGFAKAINTGLKYSLGNSKPEYVLLLNNDIELETDFLMKGIASFGISDEIGSVAVKMMNYYNRDFIDDTGDFIKANGGSPLARGMEEKDEGQYDKAEYIFSACAGAAFYKTEVFVKTGLFDEDFFAYLEDVDLGFRLQLAGYKCYYNPGIICYHKRGDTSGKVNGLVVEYSEKNLIALRLKNYPLFLYILYSPLFFLARCSRYFRFFFFYPKGIFSSAVRGYLKGVSEIPSSLHKRRIIMANKKVSSSYIRSLFK